MNLQVTRRLLAGLLLVAPIAFVIGCSAPSNSLTAPTAVVAASADAAAVNFSPNPEPPPPPPPPPPPGDGCSPGYWKNHEDAFLESCGAAAAITGDRFSTCDDLFTALTCKGSDDSCGRNEAAGKLNAVSGCTED